MRGEIFGDRTCNARITMHQHIALPKDSEENFFIDLNSEWLRHRPIISELFSATCLASCRRGFEKVKAGLLLFLSYLPDTYRRKKLAERKIQPCELLTLAWRFPRKRVAFGLTNQTPMFFLFLCRWNLARHLVLPGPRYNNSDSYFLLGKQVFCADYI